MENISYELFINWKNAIEVTLTREEKIFVVGFTILIIYYAIWGNMKEKIFISIQTACCFLLVLNPVSTEILAKILGTPFTDRVYRFLWILPIYFVYAYFATKMLIRFQKYYIVRKIIVAISVLLAFVAINQIIAGQSNTFGYNGGVTHVDNIYKIDNNVIEVSDIIENDKSDCSLAVNVVADNNINMELRAYDASLIKIGVSSPYDFYNDNIGSCDSSEFISYLKEKKCDYIVIPASNVNNDFLIFVGCINIGETSDNICPYIVYKFVA